MKSGYCDWCGKGNACCRYGSHDDVPECKGVMFPALTYHTCVQPKGGQLVLGSAGPELMGDIEVGDMDLPALKVSEDALTMQVDLSRENCLEGCNNAAGMCQYYCGAGKACCKKDSDSDPEVCKHANVYGFVSDHHECVMVMADNLTGQAAWGVHSGEEMVMGMPGLPSDGVTMGSAKEVTTATTPLGGGFLLVTMIVVAVAAVIGLPLGLGCCSGGQRTGRKRAVDDAVGQDDEEDAGTSDTE